MRKTLSNSAEGMSATDTLLVCSEEYLSEVSAKCLFHFCSFRACSPSISDQDVQASKLSTGLFNNKGTEIFVVEIARNACQRQILARQQILEILSVGFLVRQVVDGDVCSFPGKGNDCCATDARVASGDEYIEALQSPASLVAVLAAVGRDREVGLKDREARRWQCYFIFGKAVDGADQLDSLCHC